MMRRDRWRYRGDELAPTHRLEALADGVFAIVMTLLVFGLAVPAVESTNRAVTDGLQEMRGDFLIYMLSFLVLGVFWLMHKMIFDSVVGSDPPLVWLNVAFLMASALVPFSTALVGEHGILEVTAFVYGLNVLAMFGFAWAIWGYATRRGRLTAADLDPVLVSGVNRMGMAYLVLMALLVTMSFVGPYAAFISYAAFIGLIIISTMLGRWEAVMVWHRREDAGTDG